MLDLWAVVIDPSTSMVLEQREDDDGAGPAMVLEQWMGLVHLAGHHGTGADGQDADVRRSHALTSPAHVAARHPPPSEGTMLRGRSGRGRRVSASLAPAAAETRRTRQTCTGCSPASAYDTSSALPTGPLPVQILVANKFRTKNSRLQYLEGWGRSAHRFLQNLTTRSEEVDGTGDLNE